MFLYQVLQRVLRSATSYTCFLNFLVVQAFFQVADDCQLALEERLATQGHRYEECGRKKSQSPTAGIVP